MVKVADIAQKLRSKNAGPFALTIDLFCARDADYRTLCAGLDNGRVADLFGCPSADLKRFELDDLRVLKFSLPRPTRQGALADRDMHASQWAWILAELDI